MTKIFAFLDEKKIAYAVIRGVYDDDSFKEEGTEFRQDLDVVLDCNKEDVIPLLKLENDFKYLEKDSFLDISNNLRIDLYFKTLNFGYYHFLKVSPLSFQSREVSEIEYIIYQILDPLLKFSCYKKRHEYRLRQYFKKGVANNIQMKLKQIIGNNLSTVLLNKILDHRYSVSRSFIRKCKFKMLFINGNFARMIKSRVF
tara:strand:- start:672 stop:1268 length:597 start_codon:yes stop_codon:yes gene_type:complete